MKAFFISQKEAFLKVNGEFLGEVNKNIKTAEILENSLLEFMPKNHNFTPTYSSVNGCNLVKTYPLFLGTLFSVNFEKKRTFPYKILSQNSYTLGGNAYTLTVLLDGAIKFYLDGKIYASDELPFIPSSSKLEYFGGYIFVVFYGKKTAIYAYRLENGNLCYKNLVDGFELGTQFKTKTSYKKTVDISVEETYELNDNFTLLKRVGVKNKNSFSINKNLIPLLFFDLILLGVDASEILTQNLTRKQAELKEFLGDVKQTFLNPYNNSEVIALYESKLAFYSLEIKNGLIDNIIEKD